MSTPRASALPQLHASASTPNASVGPSSRVHSPVSSRDSSPAGPYATRNNNFSSANTSSSNASRGMRSRKNSHEVSPQRPQSSVASSSTTPNAAALQKALSSAGAPELQPTTTADSSRIPRAAKPGRETPSWPVSPRLKSPPPSTSSRRSSATKPQRRPEPASSVPPEIVVQAAAPTPTEESSAEPDTHHSKSSTRIGAVSTLETVQESNSPLPSDPANGE
jgi:hypothetical protein